MWDNHEALEEIRRMETMLPLIVPYERERLIHLPRGPYAGRQSTDSGERRAF